MHTEGLTNDAGENQELIESEDGEVPLADTNLVESAKHCILHFLEMLLAGGLFLYNAGSTKKQKKELAELRDKINPGKRK